MKQKILIIEDEQAITTILKDELEQSGFSTLSAKNGEIGVKLALQDHPDLILLDILMPVMNGMRALEIIRADSWGKNVPVIILTNVNADTEKLVEGMMKNKPQFYLIKSDWKISDVVKKVKAELQKANIANKG